MKVSGGLHSRFGDRDLVILELEARGLRELRSAFVEQALRAQEAERVLLVVRAAKMTDARLRHEWLAFNDLLQPTIARRLAFAAQGVNGVVMAPNEPLTTEAARLLGEPTRTERVSRPYRWDRKRFEVFGVLFDAWLEREEALPINLVATRAGVSYPTVRVTVEALAERDELVRTSSRSVALVRMPRRSLEELVPRLTELRETHFFADTSGREASPESVLARLQRKHARGLQVGGVAAARERWPAFNLNGLPRVDLTVAWGSSPQALVQSLDPALQRVPTNSPRILLAVHHSQAPLSDAFWARRSTVVFDLYCLGLNEQAEDFIRYSRP